MLGATLDYLILRGFAHRKNLATEAQLDARFARVAPGAADFAMPKLRKHVARFEGHLSLDPALRYLDLGCGSGELTVALALAARARVTGVDFLPRNIERAHACAARAGVEDRVDFMCCDLHAWEPAQKYDVLLSFDALEHVADPGAFLRRMAGFVAPGGVAALASGPLFHSPFGDHMWDFFRLQIPWRGLLFSERALLRLRTECFRPTDPARSYREIAGGLNLMRYSEFLAHVRAAGWRFEFLAVNTFLGRTPPLQRLSDALMRVPALRDYFAHNVYAVLRLVRPDYISP